VKSEYVDEYKPLPNLYVGKRRVKNNERRRGGKGGMEEGREKYTKTHCLRTNSQEDGKPH
jgi:hypothetical protein